MDKPNQIPSTIPVLSDVDKAQLHLWAQATPAQRLAWLEEALQLAARTCQKPAAS